MSEQTQGEAGINQSGGGGIGPAAAGLRPDALLLSSGESLGPAVPLAPGVTEGVVVVPPGAATAPARTRPKEESLEVNPAVAGEVDLRPDVGLGAAHDPGIGGGVELAVEEPRAMRVGMPRERPMIAIAEAKKVQKPRFSCKNQEMRS